MHCRVRTVTPLPEYILSVGFLDGKVKQYDVKPLLEKIDDFKALMYIDGLFNQVKVDAGGYGISWNEYLDLSCDELYQNGVQVGDC